MKPLTRPREYRTSKEMDINQRRAEKAQPVVQTPKGTGNYNQYSKFMLNNGRAR